MSTDGNLTKCDAFLLFSIDRSGFQNTLIRLGGVAVTHDTDATDLHKYRAPWWRATHFYYNFLPSHIYSPPKTKNQSTMSPNMTCVNSHSFSPRLTVAKRKEALELRKVREGTTFDMEMGDSPHRYMFFFVAWGIL